MTTRPPASQPVDHVLWEREREAQLRGEDGENEEPMRVDIHDIEIPVLTRWLAGIITTGLMILVTWVLTVSLDIQQRVIISAAESKILAIQVERNTKILDIHGDRLDKANDRFNDQERRLQLLERKPGG